ncbi:probable serine/threonine-protein kinase PBL20 isoform X2 [Panicum virgatum]|uniref:probable serine/threonine-protein kinase PBL20 isoform X2 n=1 Tax=Panicum virgatum TaxID=38727 RepID=UPI0019D55805|nr:probable serine/threonine-protein kinase PBL20 isoform X2 [Panicum virgatum]XP_039805650.1 probable serine/threonine-protein kinase PBL20 isoform X2 [Panicum virgatum]
MPTCNLKYCENWCPSLSNGHNIDSYCCCIGRPTACASSLWWVWLLELLAATCDFSRLLKLGEGGFGSVYKGVIRLLEGPAGGMVVAIKKLNPKGHQVLQRP